MEMDTSYYPCAVVSCIFFLFMYNFVSPTVSKMICPKYKTLSKAKQIEWDSRLLSTIHSFVVSVACLYALFFDEHIHIDPVWGDSHLVKYSCAILVGYVVYDSLIIIINYNVMGEFFYLAHHAAAIYAFWFVITYGTLTWFANFRLIAEFSTPFVNQRWFLDVLGYPKDSRIFLINGILMALMFFLCRIGSIPSYWYKVYSIYGTEPCLRLGRVWHVLTSSCLVLDFINIYWMFRIYLGAQKVLKVSLDKNRNIAVKEDGKQS